MEAPTSARRALLFAAFALLLPSPASAFCRMTAPASPAGTCEAHRVVSWPVACVGVSLNTRELRDPLDAGQDLSTLLRSHLAPSALAWSGSPCGASLALVVAPELDVALDLALDGRNVVSVNRHWVPDAHHRPGTIAFTVVSTDLRTGSLLEADVELNALAMENPLGREFGDGALAWGVADAPSVLLHELGHVVGLDHSLVDGAVMQASMVVERRRRTLTRDDLDGVCAQHPLSPARPRPSLDCAPETAAAPSIRPTASGGCSASRCGRGRVASGISVAFGALAFARRRRPRRAHLTSQHRPRVRDLTESMTLKRSTMMMKALALGLALLGGAQGCDDEDSTVVRADAREIRGIVPVRTGALRVLRIVAINARTRRLVAQTEPGADGTFVLAGVTVGAPYKVNAIVGHRVVPVTFPKSRGSTDKTNVFEIGTKDSPVSALSGPIDLGRLSEASGSTFETPPGNAPNLQEDFDGDGIVDGDDRDIDGDGVLNAMDADNDGDGVVDRVAIGDLDGDGLTAEADPDIDGDGIPNTTDPDNDNDGTPDAMDTTPSGATGTPEDLDGDGIPNADDETPHGEDAPVAADGGVPDDASAPEDASASDAGAPDDAGEVPADG